MRGDERMKSGAAASSFQRARPPRRIGRWGALFPLFRLVGVPCIAALWRVESLPRHRGDRPKLNFTRAGSFPAPVVIYDHSSRSAFPRPMAGSIAARSAAGVTLDATDVRRGFGRLLCVLVLHLREVQADTLRRAVVFCRGGTFFLVCERTAGRDQYEGHRDNRDRLELVHVRPPPLDRFGRA